MCNLLLFLGFHLLKFWFCPLDEALQICRKWHSINLPWSKNTIFRWYFDAGFNFGFEFVLKQKEIRKHWRQNTTDEPKSTEAPKTTDMPKSQDSPKSTDLEKTTDFPNLMNSEKMTDSPKSTDSPKMTDAPKLTDSPMMTDVPKSTDSLKTMDAHA